MNKDLILKCGDIITYTENNGEEQKMNIYGYAGYSIKGFETAGTKVIKVERPVKYETIYEVKEILDKEEKEYLSAVIKPFRNKIICIKKLDALTDDEEFIHISLSNDSIQLPCFKRGAMYKGMEVNKKYTLEELGI